MNECIYGMPTGHWRGNDMDETISVRFSEAEIKFCRGRSRFVRCKPLANSGTYSSEASPLHATA